MHGKNTQSSDSLCTLYVCTCACVCSLEKWRVPEYVLPGSALLTQDAKDFAKAFPSIQTLRKQAQAAATGQAPAGGGGVDSALASAATVPPDPMLQPYVSHRWARRQ